MKTKYVYQTTEGDQLSGLFDTIQIAFDEATAEAKHENEEMSFEIFDTVPATASDRDKFDGAEGFEDIDFSKPDWFAELHVPNNVVLRFTVKP